jgi:streptogrisin C
VVENSVVIEHLPEAREAAELIVAQLGLDEVPVRLDAVDEFPVLTYNIRGGDESDNTSAGFSCTIGFSITDGYLIAGHCGSDFDLVSGYNGVSQGLYKDSDWTNTDRAWVETNGSWTPRPRVNNYSGGTLSITGDMSGLEVSSVNSTVCRYGLTTGAKCGTIKAIGVNVTLSGVPLTDMTRTTACIDYGDSGGPFVSSSGYHAQGTTSGGNPGQCPQPSGKYSYFETASNALNQFSKTLVTTHGPNAPSVGSSSCVALGYGAYSCTLSGYDSQGTTSVSWSASNGNNGSGMSMTGNCSTSQTINVNITATNPYGSGYGSTSFYCYAGPLP